MHLYKEYVDEYAKAGLSVIPDKFGSKRPLISGWSDYCTRLPTKEETSNWINNFEASNVALCLGPASGIIALDFDCDDQKIIDVIEEYLPSSPVEKVGAKGWTRFFRYTGEFTNALKFNGNVVIEVLSEGKKTTIPPSKHPCGESYKWGAISILEVEKEKLPVLPAQLLYVLEQELKMAFPNSESKNRKVVNGRNDALSKYCASLIHDSVPLDEALKSLISFDEENNKPHLFSDLDEMHHNEKFTNALIFYSNHLNSFNKRAFKNNKVYSKPTTAHTIDYQLAKEVHSKKSQSGGNTKKSSPELPKPEGVLAAIQSYILSNSYIEQPAFALSAAISVLSTIGGQLFEFEGVAPNLYILNVAPSGAGKDAPQQKIKEVLALIKREGLLGAGDYVSDASLMDGLLESPVRLDIIDEAGGLLRSVNRGDASFNSKMADILAELYTCSNSIFLGRMTAMGHKGRCIRPNVNLICSTTPTGFQQGVSTEAIEKGLMGRFLVFKGEYGKPARRIEKATLLPQETIGHLEWILTREPPSTGKVIGDFEQKFFQVEKSEEANILLEEKFKEFDKIRRESDPLDKMLPIISRLYQQMLKLCLIHSLSTMGYKEKPFVNKKDVDFAYKLIIYYYYTIKDLAENNIFRNKTEEDTTKILNIIKKAGKKGISKRKLSNNTRFLKARERNEILKDLLENNFIYLSLESSKEGKRSAEIYRSTECLR
tara:strand:- start:279 stop:2417 length:2139 start_codon:yes stop_codon:yes gene_type:complete